jgi:uncharacterized protein (TIGR02266 family)
MMEIALVFGRMSAARFPAARQLLLSAPLLCDGRMVDCDLAYRMRSRLLAVVVGLPGDEDGAILSRLGFWASRQGGRVISLSALPERRRSRYRRFFSGSDLVVRGFQPPLLGAALARVAAAVGVTSESPAPAGPVLVLADSQQTWDGAAYDPDSRRLFLPSPHSPPRGDELGVVVRIAGAAASLASKARVLEVLGPGKRGQGSPAGFILQLQDPSADLESALQELAPLRSGRRRSAPRYSVEAPVTVRRREEQPVARIEYATEQELAADWVSNLSQGGAFVRTARPLPVGTEVHLEMRLPGGTILEAPATVAHVNAAGMGVRFHLDAAGEEHLGEVIARISARQRRALIVDDDVVSRRMLADALADRGFEVFSAGDGASGLDVLTDELLALDLVVADLRMPTMDGESFLKIVRGVGGEQDLAVVMVSGSIEPSVEARLHGEGADAVLDKALGPALIAQASDAVLERRQLERSH